MSEEFFPRERLKVFISSAQSEEKGVIWKDVRQRIKDYLSMCPYLNPFTIEDHPSVISSTQYFQSQINHSDLVVLLLKGEVRRGTYIEYTLATKLKKPLLVYFLTDLAQTSQVIALRNELINSDYCTFTDIDSFHNIEKRIHRDIMENIIYKFQDTYLKPPNKSLLTEVPFVPAQPATSRLGVPSKEAISLFSSSYDHLFNLLEIESNSQNSASSSILHQLGIAVLDWLVTGKAFETDRELLQIADCVAELYNDTKWLKKRLEVIPLYIKGDFENALIVERLALELARQHSIPQWIINDILIDCRNLEMTCNYAHHELTFKTEAQVELNELKTNVYLPVLDRYLVNAYEEIEHEEFRFRTASPHTVFYGSNIARALTHIENYLFSALLYGSNTHIYAARKHLAIILYRYALLLEQNDLLFQSIKLFILVGDATQLNKTISHHWDNLYSDITSRADELWLLTDNVISDQRDAIKQIIIKLLGVYLSDSSFSEAVHYLDSFSAQVYPLNSERYFEAILSNDLRIMPDKIVSMLLKIIKEQRFQLGRTLSEILCRLNLTGMDLSLQYQLCSALMDNLAYIVRNNGSPQFIAILARQNSEVFHVLESVPDNGLTGNAKLFYDINIGKGNWRDILMNQIKTAKEQFQANSKPGVFIEFGENPYATIKYVVRSHYDQSMVAVLTDLLYPLCIDILTSQCAAKIKENCMNCLCDVIVFTEQKKTDLPDSLIRAIHSVDISQQRFFSEESEDTLGFRLLMLKIVIGSIDSEQLLEWCFRYAKKTVTERIALAKCIEQFLYYCNTSSNSIDTSIISIVMQCFEDDSYEVREVACDCLVYLLQTKYHNLAEQKLYEASTDSSDYVRDHLLLIAKKRLSPYEVIQAEIISILKKDANFAIRKIAMEIDVIV